MTDCAETTALSWGRILEIASDPERWCHLDFRTADVSSRYREHGCVIDLDFKSEWLFVRNTYPYHTADDIAHYVLFRRRDLDMQSPLAFLYDKFHRDTERPVRFAWFENPSGRRSITAVRHYHVFVMGAISTM